MRAKSAYIYLRYHPGKNFSQDVVKIEYVIEKKASWLPDFKELWQYRELLYFFSWRDIKVKYKQTFLGFAWIVLQPLLLTSIFSFFIGRYGGFTTSVPYPVFVLSGLVFWFMISASVINSGNSMISNANIIKKIYFPRMIIPLSSILVAAFDLLISVVILIGYMIYYKVDINPEFALFFPLAFLLTIFSVIGPSLILSSLNVKFRDFRYLIPFVMQLMMFVSPVIYPVSNFNTVWVKYVFAINPFYAPIEIFRSCFTNYSVDPRLILISLGTALLLFILGIFYFKKTEQYLADLI